MSVAVGRCVETVSVLSPLSLARTCCTHLLHPSLSLVSVSSCPDGRQTWVLLLFGEVNVAPVSVHACVRAQACTCVDVGVSISDVAALCLVIPCWLASAFVLCPRLSLGTFFLSGVGASSSTSPQPCRPPSLVPFSGIM